MTKITIDQLTKEPIAYIDAIPHQKIPNEVAKPLTLGSFSASLNSPVDRDLIISKLEQLVGELYGNNFFADFEKQEIMPNSVFDNELVRNISFEHLMEKLSDVEIFSQKEEEELFVLKAFVSECNKLNEILKRIKSQIQRLQKG